MPLSHGNDEDRLVLVHNEEEVDRSARPPHLDEEAFRAAGGFAADDQDMVNNFVPATLPEDHAPPPGGDPTLQRSVRTGGEIASEGNFHNIDLRQVILDKGPPDRFYYVYMVFYLLGIATMTPWNFFITAEDYWMYKFRNVTSNSTGEPPADLTPLQKSFTCDLTLTASISGTAFLILNAVYGHKFSLKLKMFATLITILVIFIITTIFVEINTDQWQEQFFLITLLTVIIINVSSAVMSGTVFGIVGLFPAEYMAALVSGQALGGIFTAVTFILVLAFGLTPTITAFVYFIIGSMLITLSILNYGVMEKIAFFRYYIEGGGDKPPIEDAGIEDAHGSAVLDVAPKEPKLREVLDKIYVEVVSVCLLFATTLSVYPAVSVLMNSEHFGNGKAWNDIYYLPVVNYLFFNSGDYFGRILAGLWMKPSDNRHTVLLIILLRILYVPFFLCSNSNLHVYLPVLVQHDVSFILMMLTFGISNGYLANIVLIMAPRAVEFHEKELASYIMAASLSLGLALGSMLSMIFVQML